MNIATTGTETATDATRLARETQTLRHLAADCNRELQGIEGELPDARRSVLAGVPGAEHRVGALEVRQNQLKAEAARLDGEHLQKTQDAASQAGEWARRASIAREFCLTPEQAGALKGETPKQLRAHAQQMAAASKAEPVYEFQSPGDVAW